MKRSTSDPPTLDDPDLPRATAPPLTSYNSRKMRLVVTVSAQACRESAAPPQHLVDQARARMHELKRAGKAALIIVHDRHLARVWTALRTAVQSGAPAPESVTLLLAAAAPDLPGLAIKAPPDGDSLALLSIAPDSPGLAFWDAGWLELHLRRALRARGVKARLNPTEIQGALVRAQAGEPVQDLALHGLQAKRPRHAPAFHLVVNPARGEVSLLVYDLAAVGDVAGVVKRIARIEQALLRLKATGRGRYRIRRPELIDALQAALAGPEQLGIGLPMKVLVAVRPAVPAAEASAPPPKKRPGQAPTPPTRAPAPPTRAPAPPAALVFAVALDRMSAWVAGLAPDLTESHLNDDCIDAALKVAGIVHGLRPGFAAELRRMVAERQDVRGLAVAAATPPVAGSGPSLALAARPEDLAGGAMRAYRRQPLAEAGTLIAAVRYATPPVPGADVTGKPLPLPPADPCDGVTLGEGVERRADGGYYATFSGVVELEAGALRLVKALLHKGDANLASGDIEFDGPIEITGNIDSGARVKAGGDLIVRGEICGGRVECAGNVQVGRGIVVGPRGLVRARGDVTADFIENSTVTCRGNLTAKRSILQSQITAGGTITVTSGSGVIGGGVLACGGDVRTQNLGLPSGALTVVTAGVDARVAGSIRVRAGRLAALTASAEEDRRAFKGLMQKHPSRFSKADKLAKERLRVRIARWSGILTAAQGYLDLAGGRLKYDAAARVFVPGQLAANCQIKLGGRAIPVRDVAAVVVSSVEHEGSYLRAFSDDGGK